MKESSKTNEIRSEYFKKKILLNKKILDIGSGNDCLPNAEPFDLINGDANFILNSKSKKSYDVVHSSHCLEHMNNPYKALREWWKLLKPGGYLILTVPDEDLYEQGFFPSIFNTDHKYTFTIYKRKSWSPVSINIEDLVSKLPSAKIISCKIQDNFYNYNFTQSQPSKYKSSPLIYEYILKLFYKLKISYELINYIEKYLFKKYHRPIDQTRGKALAQIEIIAQKN